MCVCVCVYTTTLHYHISRMFNRSITAVYCVWFFFSDV